MRAKILAWKAPNSSSLGGLRKFLAFAKLFWGFDSWSSPEKCLRDPLGMFKGLNFPFKLQFQYSRGRMRKFSFWKVSWEFDAWSSPKKCLRDPRVLFSSLNCLRFVKFQCFLKILWIPSAIWSRNSRLADDPSIERVPGRPRKRRRRLCVYLCVFLTTNVGGDFCLLLIFAIICTLNFSGVCRVRARWGTAHYAFICMPKNERIWGACKGAHVVRTLSRVGGGQKIDFWASGGLGDRVLGGFLLLSASFVVGCELWGLGVVCAVRLWVVVVCVWVMQ